MNTVGYVRVSTEEQAHSTLGLAAQHHAITHYCQTHNLDLSTILEDQAVSGSQPLAKRPAGSQLLSLAGRNSTIVVARLDRLFRSVADAAATIATLNALNISLISITENFDMTNPYGRAMAQMASVFAELEREMIRSRTKDALHTLRLKNRRISRFPPYGSNLKGKFLTDNPREQSVIRLITRFHNRKLSPRAIAHRLNGLAIPTKHNRTWTHTSIISILQRLGLYHPNTYHSLPTTHGNTTNLSLVPPMFQNREKI